MITSGDEIGIAMITSEQAIDTANSSGPSSHTQRAALTKVSLQIRND
jgi:hypothetical protein